jgi:hypothetical protein
MFLHETIVSNMMDYTHGIPQRQWAWLYAEQNEEICSTMKKNQTDFLKLCLADALIKLLETRDYADINVNEICELAVVGRTTFYRHLDKNNGKEELLLFKITYEWDRYQEKHDEEIRQDRNLGMSSYIYENRKLFSLLYKRGLITLLMRAFEVLIPGGAVIDKNLSYLMSFFTYGYFGIIYQWIKYDFDESPEQVKRHIDETIFSAMGK